MNPPPTAAAELELVERVELRFALASTDAQLAAAVNTFLVPLLQKLASPNAAAVQPNVLALLSHINTRLRAAASVTLPTPAIVALLGAPATPAVVRNFALVYLEMAIDRTPAAADRATLVPSLLAAVASFGPTPLPVTSPALPRPYQLLVVQLLACIHAMQLPPVNSDAVAVRDAIAEKVSQAHWEHALAALTVALVAPAAPIDPAVKRSLCSFAVFYVPAPLEPVLWQRALLLFAASCDAHNAVAEHAETAWRKVKIDVEDPQLVDAVLTMYPLQPAAPQQQQPQSPVSLQQVQSLTQGALATKTKVLAFAQKSKRAASAFPACIKITFDALFATATVPRLQQAGLAYLQWVARMADQSLLERIAPVLVSGTLRTVKDEPTGPLAEYALTALGLLLKRVPQQLTPDILDTLFAQARAGPPAHLKLALQDCLTGILFSMSTPPANLELLTAGAAGHASDLFRWVALRYTGKLAPLALPTLALHLQLTADASHLVRQEAAHGLELEALVDAAAAAPSFDEVLGMVRGLPGKIPHAVREASVEFLFRYLAVTALGHPVRRSVVPESLRDHAFARKYRDWIRANSDAAAAWTRFLLDNLFLSGAPYSLQGAALRRLSPLADLGPAIPLRGDAETAALATMLYQATNPAVMWSVRRLLPAAFDAPGAHLDANTPVVRAAELARVPDAAACLAALGQGYGPLVETVALLQLEALARSRSLVATAETVDKVKTLVAAAGTPSQVVCGALAALGWMGYFTADDAVREAAVKILTDHVPASSNAKTSPNVLLSAGEAVAVLVAGPAAKCIPFDQHVSFTESTAPATTHASPITAVLAMDTAVKPTRRAQLTYLESLVTSVPALDARTVEAVHDVAVRALIVPEWADLASRCLMQIHLAYLAASPGLMPAVSRALASAPPAASSARAFVLFDCLVAAAREVGKPSLACDLLKVLDDMGLMVVPGADGGSAAESSASESAIAAAAAAAADDEKWNALPATDLVPVLFRLQCHPNTHVAACIKSLVSGLVSTPRPALATHFPRIFHAVHRGLSHSAPLVRETSLLALLELLKLRDAESVVAGYLSDDLCRAALKLLDDVHDAIQAVAVRTCGVLCQRMDPAVVVPFLLDGLRSAAAAVTKFALSTLLKLCQDAPHDALLPQIATITTALLDALSALEPQVLNYISFHVHKYDMSADQLDGRRLLLLQSSPVMGTLETLIGRATKPADVEGLVAALAGVVRKGVGLPTRGGVARAILLLRSPVLASVPGAADTLLKALSGAVFDANMTVRHVMAAAAAHVIGAGAQQVTVTKFIAHLVKQYLTTPDRRAAVADVALACSKSPASKDVFNGVLSAHLPLTAIGMHAAKPVSAASASADGTASNAAAAESSGIPDEADEWRRVWQAYVNVDATATRMYGGEIASLAAEWVAGSQDWAIQDQAARTLAWVAADPHRVPVPADALAAVFHLATIQKREALVTSVARLAAAAAAVPDAQHTARAVLEWMLAETMKANRGYDLLADMITAMAPHGLADGLPVIDAAVKAAHKLVDQAAQPLSSKRRAAVTAALESAWHFLVEAYRALSRGARPAAVADMPGFLAVFAALNAQPEGVTGPAASAAAVRDLATAIPLLARAGTDLTFVLADVARVPACLEVAANSLALPQRESVAALVALMYVATGLPRPTAAVGPASPTTGEADVNAATAQRVRTWLAPKLAAFLDNPRAWLSGDPMREEVARLAEAVRSR
ncbi:proteasome component M29 [Blastocladiella emersonii ATCC 22665]|nr:proteasome component M29 [Blastocladiella emersonii ATCC 22665]